MDNQTLYQKVIALTTANQRFLSRINESICTIREQQSKQDSQQMETLYQQLQELLSFNDQLDEETNCLRKAINKTIHEINKVKQRNASLVAKIDQLAQPILQTDLQADLSQTEKLNAELEHKLLQLKREHAKQINRENPQKCEAYLDQSVKKGKDTQKQLESKNQEAQKIKEDNRKAKMTTLLQIQQMIRKHKSKME